MFSRKLSGAPVSAPWDAAAWDADADWDFTRPPTTPRTRLYAIWDDTCAGPGSGWPRPWPPAASTSRSTWPGRAAGQPAPAGLRPDRGVRPAHRARRPAPRGGGRPGRRGSAAGLAPEVLGGDRGGEPLGDRGDGGRELRPTADPERERHPGQPLLRVHRRIARAADQHAPVTRTAESRPIGGRDPRRDRRPAGRRRRRGCRDPSRCRGSPPARPPGRGRRAARTRARSARRRGPGRSGRCGSRTARWEWHSRYHRPWRTTTAHGSTSVCHSLPASLR